MDNYIDQNLYAESMKIALRVNFLANSEELRLYATLSIMLQYGAEK